MNDDLSNGNIREKKKKVGSNMKKLAIASVDEKVRLRSDVTITQLQNVSKIVRPNGSNLTLTSEPPWLVTFISIQQDATTDTVSVQTHR